MRRLKAGGTDPHSLKPSGGLEDLFKDKDGNIYVGNKDGTGEMEETGLNISDY